MNHRILFPLSLAALAACATIGPAPEGSPRIEAEVVTLVDGSIHDTLTFEQQPEPVEQRFAALIAPLADLGTRFYAVPTEAYQSDHARPDYLLTVELVDITPRLEQETVKVGEEQHVTTRVAALYCTVSARVERRRQDAPTLPVCLSEAYAEQSLERVFKTGRPPSRMIPLRHLPETGEALEVRADDLDALIERAALRALRELERPVDRELSLLRGRGLG